LIFTVRDILEVSVAENFLQPLFLLSEGSLRFIGKRENN
jgi:hypothetical protein